MNGLSRGLGLKLCVVWQDSVSVFEGVLVQGSGVCGKLVITRPLEHKVLGPVDRHSAPMYLIAVDFIDVYVANGPVIC
jgi:hypothetical protein